MSIYKGTTLLSGISTNTVSNAHTLLDWKWSDHIINSMEWLRADTFSWQSGDVYTSVYNHLVADNSGGTSQTETIGSYTITYVLADDGHKITTDETTVANIYSESGVAWYYVLDTINQRFKLPRTKYGFVGLRDTVGKYVPESLPNITGNLAVWGNDGVWGLVSDTAASAFNSQGGAFQTYSVGWSQAVATGKAEASEGVNFNASRSSSTYQDDAPVQQRATQMYLYFYVGQFSQSATEQTAGLNAELFNGKVDLDSSWGFPSNSFDTLTLGASGTQYTAPDDGWYTLRADGNSSYTHAFITNTSNGLCSGYTTGSNGNSNVHVFIPAKKGQTVKVEYSDITTTHWFRFVYAQKTN